MLDIITLFAGRFTPAASVEVQNITLIRLYLNKTSIASRSSPLRPLWWKATVAQPFSMKYFINWGLRVSTDKEIR